MTWRLVADSSCDLHTLPESDAQISFDTIPFNISIGPHEYTDDSDLDVDAMLTANESRPEAAHTACPAPQLWLDAFSRPGPVLAFTISSALSGSYNSACVARNMLLEQQPNRQIAVIDSKATGPEEVLLLRRACALIREGLPFERIPDALRACAERTHIIFALSSYHNLIKTGRVSRLAGLVAGRLGFWGIGVGDDEGKIAMRGKARGEKHMIRTLIGEMRQHGLAGREIVISHCLNEQTARQLKDALLEAFGNIAVDILPTRGLDSFYAERHGLIVAY